MESPSYRGLTIDTFCKSAIRSVMMIDDDFLPYDQLAKLLSEPDASRISRASRSMKAANIHHFFQKRRISCDVDNGTEHLDPERVRKCDLIILDYHLENESPARSIELIRSLRNNPHMNLVVVYTSEELEKTWREICASLRGGGSYDYVLEKDDVAKKAWEAVIETFGSVPPEWMETPTNSEISTYLLNFTFGPVQGRLRKLPEVGEHAEIFAQAICERHIEQLNVVASQRDEQPIVGNNSGVRWLQSGNVFIALHRKSAEENDAQGIWESLTTAVANWSPTYYQLIVSEVQNWLENEALPFSASALSDAASQAAWLSSILQEESSVQSTIMVEQLLERLNDEIKEKLLANVDVKGFTNQVLAKLRDETIKFNARDEFDRFSALHLKMKNAKSQPEVQNEMFHSLNTNLCSRAFTGDHITNGTVLHDSESDKFYLCVSPACDAVPEQQTSNLASRLAPHRFMKVLQLGIANLGAALVAATFGRNIFIRLGDRRLALEVQHPDSHNPMIDYALVHNHIDRNREIVSDGIAVSFMDISTNEEIFAKRCTLIPIAQLRESYTARFQTVASHHAGRVGVDFVGFPAREPFVRVKKEEEVVLAEQPPAANAIPVPTEPPVTSDDNANDGSKISGKT